MRRSVMRMLLETPPLIGTFAAVRKEKEAKRRRVRGTDKEAGREAEKEKAHQDAQDAIVGDTASQQQ